MKKLFFAIGATLLSAGCTAQDGQGDQIASAADPADPASAFHYMGMAASSDLFEIESSRLALQMSRNEAVRSFAQMMVSDHSRTTSEMQSIARSVGIQPPPPTMVPHHRDMLDRLRSASPGMFDRAYADAQIMAHEEAIALHSAYAERGDTPAFRDFAARTVPVIRMHYEHAQRLGAQSAPLPPPTAPVRAGERG